MNDPSAKETELKETINSTLENYGYLSYIRSELRIRTLKLAREMVSNGEIEGSSIISPKKPQNDGDDLMISLIYDLIRFLRLEQTQEMLDLELDPSFKKADIASVLPQINNGERLPALVKLVRMIK